MPPANNLLDTTEQPTPVWLSNLTEVLNATAKTWRFSFSELSPEKVSEALRRCSERRQEFVQTYYADPSMTYEHLAELLGVTPAHAKLTIEMSIPEILGSVRTEQELSDNIGEEIDENGRRILWKNVNGQYYVDTDGVLKKEDVMVGPGFSNVDKDMHISRRSEAELAAHGYHPGARVIAYPKLLEDNLGKTWDEFLADVDRRVSDSAKSGESKRRILADDARRLNDMNSRFNGMVRCFEKSTLRIFNTGFTVKILLDTDDMNEMTIFIRKNSKALLEWVIESIKDTKKIMKFIGDMDFYNPVKMVCLKGGEVEVFFEVKEKKPEKTP